MRHNKKRYQLNRFTSWHKATVNSLVRNLLIYQSIKTTQARAKAARSLAEKLISLGKENSLAAKRAAYKFLGDHRLVKLLFSDIAPRYNSRQGGYTRILPYTRRRGDDAQLVVFELTEKKIKQIVKKAKKEKEPVSLHPQEQPKEKPRTSAAVEEKERPGEKQKSSKGFLKGIRGIFKKERDSL
ncbi:MAG: 50S ribosomal protein L17 [Candidatus Omnitrophica bacterium]|nr:50S ribosomal protein L17 [Candidatus Omnitrophota bacterium]MDD5611121.1 50S ribosomal protein L17 [Candidatus Omnitrophota bacterium]